MKFGFWLLPVVAIGTAGTILAAALPVPPSLPGVGIRVEPGRPAQVAAAPAPATQAIPAAPRAPAIARPRDVTAAAIATPGAGPKHLARRPARRLVRATLDHNSRSLAHAAGPRYGTIVAGPPGPYPGMAVRGPTQIAMAPPPYGMPAPYRRTPYSPY
jgi:hypothetical protein